MLNAAKDIQIAAGDDESKDWMGPNLGNAFFGAITGKKIMPLMEEYYRRTLLWMPEVEFDAKGSATVRLYNNSKRTSVSVEAVGVTDSGRYMQYNSVR